MATSLGAHIRRHSTLLAAGVLCLLATNALAQAIPWMVKLAIDALGRHAPPEVVGRYALGIAALAAAGAVIRVASRTLIFDVGRAVEYEVRNDLFSRLLALAPSFYRRRSTGDLMSRLTNDLGAVRGVMGPGILYVFNTLFAYAIAVPLMARIDPMLTLLSLSPYPLLYVVARVFSRRVYSHSRQVQDQLARVSAAIQEDLTGIQLVKNYRLEDRRLGNFRTLTEEHLRLSLELSRIRGIITPLMGTIGALGALIALGAGGHAVMRGRITLGDLIAFQMYLATLAWPTMAIGWILTMWQRGLASWARLVEVMEEVPTIADPEGKDGDGDASERLRGDVEVRELTIDVDGARLLDGVSLRVAAGTVCAIVGRVGAGKTTLVEALPRLIEVPRGTVFVGGHDVTEVPLRRLRRSIAYAPQDGFLFSTTIRRNIEIGSPTPTLANGTGNGAARREAERLASAAGLEPDLAALPDGLDTVVGERGITLSGGQRQRTALARALAADAPILILDDSLCSVDAHTERQILERLRRELAGRTVFVVSHRLSALRDADQIVVLDRGRVVERGRHDELIGARGVYSELYSRQVLEEELEVLP